MSSNPSAASPCRGSVRHSPMPTAAHMAPKAMKVTHFDVWVDFDGPVFGTGTYSSPFRSVADGVDFLIEGQNPSHLPEMHLSAGSTSETITITKPMVLEACGGSVVIGMQ